jgi:hypothetical protein
MKVGVKGVYEWVYSALDTSPEEMVMAQGLSTLGLFALSHQLARGRPFGVGD